MTIDTNCISSNRRPGAYLKLRRERSGEGEGGRLLGGGRLIEGDTYWVSTAIAQQFKRKTPREHSKNNENEKIDNLPY